jgi:hypothetical protein
MRAFCGKDQTLSALAFAKPSTDKFRPPVPIELA